MNREQSILQPYKLGDLVLRNRVVISSLTCGRTDNKANAPNSLHATYYSQRASAGLIVTESAWVGPKAIGFINLPGIFSAAQVEGWKLVTTAVHNKRGKIFLQIVHGGAVSYPDFFIGGITIGGFSH